jgi:hypothetical protein
MMSKVKSVVVDNVQFISDCCGGAVVIGEHDTFNPVGIVNAAYKGRWHCALCDRPITNVGYAAAMVMEPLEVPS